MLSHSETVAGQSQVQRILNKHEGKIPATLGLTPVAGAFLCFPPLVAGFPQAFSFSCLPVALYTLRGGWTLIAANPWLVGGLQTTSTCQQCTNRDRLSETSPSWARKIQSVLRCVRAGTDTCTQHSSPSPESLLYFSLLPPTLVATIPHTCLCWFWLSLQSCFQPCLHGPSSHFLFSRAGWNVGKLGEKEH